MTSCTTLSIIDQSDDTLGDIKFKCSGKACFVRGVLRPQPVVANDYDPFPDRASEVVEDWARRAQAEGTFD